MKLIPLDPPADGDDLRDLLAVIEIADGHHPIGEHKYLTLAQPGGTSAFVPDDVGGGDSGLAAFVATSPPGADGVSAAEIAVHPTARQPQYLDQLVAAVTDTATAMGARTLRAWTYLPNLARAFERAGFVPERELRQMRIELPLDETPSCPPGVRLRSFRPGEDEAAWLAVNNEAFAGHPENGGWTIEDLRHRMAQAWFEPDRLIIAEDGRGVCGFCWTKPQGDAGEIYVVAVADRCRGRGLGRCLVVAGLHRIAGEGFKVGVLYVDAHNVRALGLYRSLGFRLDHVDRSFRKPLTGDQPKG